MDLLGFLFKIQFKIREKYQSYIKRGLFSIEMMGNKDIINLGCDEHYWKQQTLIPEEEIIRKEDISLNKIRDLMDKVDCSIQQELPLEKPKPPEVATKIKKTYSQDWPAYEQAKSNEFGIVKSLASELIEAYLNSPYSQKEFKLREELFCMIIHIYFGGSFRKTISILKSINDNRFISKVPCYKTLSNYFSDVSLTKILEELITISSLPLASLEENLAIDSSGFAKNMYSQWSEYKWGKFEGKEREWLKLHACIGTKTNIFVKVSITKKNVADPTEFPSLLKNSKKYIDAKTVVADLAYSSRKNLDVAFALGLIPYIPFKKNATGKAKGSETWHKMFRAFQINQEEYLQKYHCRSNVETNFHMLKTRFGNKLHTKSFEAEKNELLTKVLVHNLCVLNQESFELGIKLDFEACVKQMVTV